MWLIENWFIIMGLLAVAAVIGYVAGQFMKLPRVEQIVAVKEWLLYACIQAEKEMGSGTGKLKLRYVYDWFVLRFPWAARVISFDTFSLWVDSALLEMNTLLQSNRAVSELVEGAGV